jgi:hypothetical protein
MSTSFYEVRAAENPPAEILGVMNFGYYLKFEFPKPSSCLLLAPTPYTLPFSVRIKVWR